MPLDGGYTGLALFKADLVDDLRPLREARRLSQLPLHCDPIRIGVTNSKPTATAQIKEKTV